MFLGKCGLVPQMYAFPSSGDETEAQRDDEPSEFKQNKSDCMTEK